MLMQSTIGCAQGCQVCLTFAPSRQELKTGCARSLCKVCNPLVLAPIQYTVAAPKHASHVVSKNRRIMGSRLDPTPPPQHTHATIITTGFIVAPLLVTAALPVLPPTHTRASTAAQTTPVDMAVDAVDAVQGVCTTSGLVMKHPPYHAACRAGSNETLNIHGCTAHQTAQMAPAAAIAPGMMKLAYQGRRARQRGPLKMACQA